MAAPDFSGLLQTSLDVVGGLSKKLLKPPRKLVVLSVGLVFRKDGPIVHFELDAANAGAEAAPSAELPNLRAPWDVPYDAFDPSGRGELDVPPGVLEDLRFRLAACDMDPAEPLWLRLLRPYGWLGTAPWEMRLSDSLRRPVLRLPDFPDRPVERADVLQAAVIVDVPATEDTEAVLHRVRVIADAVLQASGRIKTQVHVFTTTAWRSRLRGLARDVDVLVHEPLPPPLATDALVPPTSSPLTIAAAWTTWMLEALHGDSVDALFVLARARASETSSHLVFTDSAATSDVPGACEDEESWIPDAMVGLAELELLLNRIGACAATFVPAMEGDRKGMLAFADALARRRPGAVLCHPVATGSTVEAFNVACRLLLGGVPAPAPVLGDGLLYCHPSFVEGFAQLGMAHSDDFGAAAAQLLARRAPFKDRLLRYVTGALPVIRATEVNAPPSWVASTQRFLESARFEEFRRLSKDVLLSTSSLEERLRRRERKVDEQVDEIRKEIQRVVSEFASKRGMKK
ncbi:hypothetical protein FUT87_07400 [Mitsuaria sp. TWR114]|uniref:hypothetical protein n=1 Tax=Mitsuaria sp. TWR114 TaxID=2601731 RepID=UPI0011BEAC86|nr:hypothetical protein [Mitsuaria sp. TWR114]TXD94227.1 hypothetical protein FUT87_07400 [Mitsuaria sp. TWR114]